jgi:hypothetical protein
VRKFKSWARVQALVRGALTRITHKKHLPILKKQQQVRRFCIECESKVATKRCHQCKDRYCDSCYNTIHRKGNRRGHTSEAIGNVLGVKDLAEPKKASGKLTGGLEAALERAKTTSNSRPSTNQWEEHFDAAAKAKYWYNTITGEATWVCPY